VTDRSSLSKHDRLAKEIARLPAGDRPARYDLERRSSTMGARLAS
jgi:hypothetical protein